MKRLDVEKIFSNLGRKVKQTESKDNSWGVDRLDATQYFRGFEVALKAVKDLSEKVKQEGRRFIHVDIAGRATFPDREKVSDKTYSLSLGYKHKDLLPDLDVHKGNVFNSVEFDRFIDNIKSKEESVQLVTMETIAGLQNYDPQIIAIQTFNRFKDVEQIFLRLLYRRIKKINVVLQVGGLIILGNNHFLNEYFREHPDYFTKFFTRLGYTFEGDQKDIRNSSKFLLKRIR
jgi:hypothetical protein